MAEQHFVRMSDQPDQATLVVINDEGHLVSGPEALPLETIARRVEGGSVTVLLPAQDIVSCVADIPVVSVSRVRQMLPFSLEDDFAGDVDELHFAAGERNDANRLAVSVIARRRLDFWLGALRSAGIHPRRICSEGDGAPDIPGTVTLFLDGDKVLGRRPGGAPFGFEGLALGDLWTLLEAETKASEGLEHVVLFIDRDSWTSRQDEIDALRGRAQGLDVKELPQGCLTKLASSLVYKPGPNLLQGGYGTRSDIRALARPWRVAAGFALAFLAVSVLGKGAELIKLSKEERRLTEEAATICTESYGSNQISRCLLEMGRRLADTGQAPSSGDVGFLATLTEVAGALDDAMRISSISYRDQVLALEINTPNATYLDAFDQRLTQGGRFAFAMQNTTNEQDGSLTVRARIVAVEP